MSAVIISISEGARLKAEGMEAVRKEWNGLAVSFVERCIPIGWEGLWEEIYDRMKKAKGFYPPQKPQERSAACNSCKHRGLLVGTGEWRHSTLNPKNHDHPYQVLRRV